MAVVRQGGNPNVGKVMTTTGLKEARPPVCTNCRERRPGLYTLDANGSLVCGQCSGSFGEGILRDKCDPDTCACGAETADESDPS